MTITATPSILLYVQSDQTYATHIARVSATPTGGCSAVFNGTPYTNLDRLVTAMAAHVGVSLSSDEDAAESIRANASSSGIA